MLRLKSVGKQVESSGAARMCVRKFSWSASLPRAFGIRDNYLLNEANKSVSNDPLLDKLRKKEAIKVTITGGAGAIGYATLFRVGNGEMLGSDQPISLTCLELPNAMNALEGVMMEMEDCAFPNVININGTDDANRAFDGCDIALFIGSKPRTKGMERSDLIRDNGVIFQKLGHALEKSASSHCRSVVVGNPCNTNCYILANNAPRLKKKNFSAMTRLDHDRAVAMLASKSGQDVNEVNKFAIWGNHSPMMFPDLTHTQIHGVPWYELIGWSSGERYWKNELIPKVQRRGQRILEVRGSSSAASAANAVISHTRDWVLGKDDTETRGDWTSMAVISNGEYGVPQGLVFSFPVICSKGTYHVVTLPNPLNEYMQYQIERNVQELQSEIQAVSHLLS